MAERNLLRWSFRVARGMAAPEILATVSEASMVVLGRAGWSPARLGSAARAVAVSAPGPALIVGCEARPGSTVVVLYDGSPASERALALAAGLARKDDIMLLIPAEVSQDVLSLRDRAERQLVEHGMSVYSIELPSGDMRALARVANRQDADLLLVPGDAPVEQALADLVEEIECPVMLVRPVEASGPGR